MIVGNGTVLCSSVADGNNGERMCAIDRATLHLSSLGLVNGARTTGSAVYAKIRRLLQSLTAWF